MKTATDSHWNERALSVADDVEVNIMDVFQREIEYDYVCRYLDPEQRMLEVGCGNGFSTDRFRARAGFVDAFDSSEEMIARARRAVGETNNRFFVDNVLDPRRFEAPYDAAVCVRVLINLADLEQQKLALVNIASALRLGGVLVLAEGFRDGFDVLGRLRGEVGLPPVQPAAINFYSSLSDLDKELADWFEPIDTFHLGSYDFLTRVVYPLLASPQEVSHNTVVSERCSQLARVFNPDCLESFSRMRGIVLRRR